MDAVIASPSRKQPEKLYLNEERILGDKVGLATCEVYGGTENNRVMRGLGEMQESVFKESTETAKQLGQPLKESVHVNGLQENCQTRSVSTDRIWCSDVVKLKTDGVFGQHRHGRAANRKTSGHLSRRRDRISFANGEVIAEKRYR
jgi:hypothetical protein